MSFILYLLVMLVNNQERTTEQQRYLDTLDICLAELRKHGDIWEELAKSLLEVEKWKERYKEAVWWKYGIDYVTSLIEKWGKLGEIPNELRAEKLDSIDPSVHNLIAKYYYWPCKEERYLALNLGNFKKLDKDIAIILGHRYGKEVFQNLMSFAPLDLDFVKWMFYWDGHYKDPYTGKMIGCWRYLLDEDNLTGERTCEWLEGDCPKDILAINFDKLFKKEDQEEIKKILVQFGIDLWE